MSAASAGPIGVSPGRVRGEVTHDPLAASGKILVVRTLDPVLASALPVVTGLVAETGSPLSHLAILAREYRVPAVVGVVGAPDRFGDGDVVVVDGASGTIELVSAAPAGDPARPAATDTETAR